MIHLLALIIVVLVRPPWKGRSKSGASRYLYSPSSCLFRHVMQRQLLLLRQVVISSRIRDRFVLGRRVGLASNVDRDGSWSHQPSRRVFVRVDSKSYRLRGILAPASITCAAHKYFRKEKLEL